MSESKKVLVTGGSGFLGGALIDRLMEMGWNVTSIDLSCPATSPEGVLLLEFDLAEYKNFSQLDQSGYDIIFHLATALDFDKKHSRDLFESNVQATSNILRFAKDTGSKKIVFTSSNSIYMGNKLDRPITECDSPVAIDEYGKSKIASEEILLSLKDEVQVTIIRCPNIMDAGRVGMLSILFDFVNEGRKTWILGSGKIRHQCVYAPDVVNAILLADKLDSTQVYNIGSDDVSTIREMYDHIVNKSNSGARTARVPLYPTLWLLQILNRLKLSPLGPYQFRMLTRNFEFDTSKIKRDLGWAPTLNNKDMLWKSFEFYKSNFDTINSGQLSANQSRVALKLISVLKFFS